MLETDRYAKPQSLWSILAISLLSNIKFQIIFLFFMIVIH